MAAISESSVYESEITRVETTDVALGGNEVNVPNKQFKQIANRFKFLKDAVDSLTADLATAENDIIALETAPISDTYWVARNTGSQVISAAGSGTIQVSLPTVASQSSSIFASNRVTVPTTGFYLIGGSLACSGPLSPVPNSAQTACYFRLNTSSEIGRLGADRDYFDGSMTTVIVATNGTWAGQLTAGNQVDMVFTFNANSGTFAPTLTLAQMWGIKLF